MEKRLNIAAIERDTGIGKDTLRVWERRYGFPRPVRDEQGDRLYTTAQIEKLRLIKRLLDSGLRAGAVVPMTATQLRKLAQERAGTMTAAPSSNTSAAHAPAVIDQLLTALKSHSLEKMTLMLHAQLSRLGLAKFVNELMAPMNAAVGDRWLAGELEIHEEHLYTELMYKLLRAAIQEIAKAKPGSPVVLLSTFPNEPHGLGLLMAEAMFSLAGCRCLSLGTQTPVLDIAKASDVHNADIVALSFTSCLSTKLIMQGLVQLRAKLPKAVDIWAGGANPALLRYPLDGIRVVQSLASIPEQLRK